MTAFLTKSPRRKWHPSQWNIARVGSALGTTLALGACQGDTISATSEADTTDGATSEADATDGTGVDDSTDYSDDTDWADDYADYSESPGWYYECFQDDQCGPGMQCNDGYCEPFECSSSSDCAFDEFCDENSNCVEVDVPAECLAPALTEIPLPDAAGGEVVALRFVDVDGDPGEELVLLRDDAIVVVDGDQSMTVPHSGLSLDALAATDVDEDGVIDLIATSSTKLNSRVFLADGMGGFFDGGVGPGMRLDHVDGIDWPTGGAGELLARTQGGEAAILANLAQLTPDIEPVDGGPVDALATGDFNGDGVDDLVMLEGCHPQVFIQSGSTIGSEGVGPFGSCSLSVGDYDGDPLSDVVVLRADVSFSVVTVHAPFGEQYSWFGLPGAYQAVKLTSLGGAPNSMLAQSSGELQYLFSDPNSALCRGTLDELPPVQQFTTGDFDGDGDEELAVIDVDGTTTLWSD